MGILYFIRKRFITSNNGKGWTAFIYPGIMFIWIFTFLLLNAMYLGYGNPKGVKQVMVSDGKLYVADFLLGGGSRATSASPYSRIHILEPETGKKIFRFPTGESGELTGIKGDSLIFYGDDLLKIFSSSNGKLIAKLNRKTLPKIFPELSSGIDNVGVSHSEKMLELRTLDGNHYNLSMKTAVLYPAKNNKFDEEPELKNKLYINNEHEIVTNNKPGGTTLLQLDGDNGNQEIRYIKGRNNSKVNDAKFLMGHFIAVSEKHNCFVILSYETTKKIGLTLTGLTLSEQNKLWELKHDSLKTEDDPEYPLTTAWAMDDNSGTLFFAMKDEVIAIEILTGSIIWRQKL